MTIRSTYEETEGIKQSEKEKKIRSTFAERDAAQKERKRKRNYT